MPPKYFEFETCHGVARMPSPPPLAACYSATVSAPPPLILPLLPPPILLTEYTRCFVGKPQALEGYKGQYSDFSPTCSLLLSLNPPIFLNPPQLKSGKSKACYSGCSVSAYSSSYIGISCNITMFTHASYNF